MLQWKVIDDPSLSPDGEWLTFVLTPMEGDPVLALKAVGGDGPALTVRGTDPTFTANSRHLVYAVPPSESEVDALKRAGTEDEGIPKNALAVADIAAVFVGGEARLGGIRGLGPVESYAVAPEGSWLAYVSVEEEDGTDGTEESEAESQRRGDGAAKRSEPERCRRRRRGRRQGRRTVPRWCF